jgi:hypothetical protein
MRAFLVLCGLTTIAAADPNAERARVEGELTKSFATGKACGKRFHVVYDWRAYDAIDWKTAGKDPNEYYASERPSVRDLGTAVDQLCGVADYRAMMSRVDTIVYRPIGDKGTRLGAAIRGTTLTITNNIFGSTRDADDYVKALEATAVPQAAKPAPPPPEPAPAASPPTAPPTKPAKPAKPAKLPVAAKPVKPTKAAPASKAWDGAYTYRTASVHDDACFRASDVTPIKVADGIFSYVWIPYSWPTKDPRLGHVNGVAHADGSVTSSVTFTDPARTSQEVKLIKAWRDLESVTSVPMHFAKVEEGRALVAELDLGSGHCSATWVWSDPKVGAARAAKEPPPPPAAKEPPPSRADQERQRQRERDEEQARQRMKEHDEQRDRDEESRRGVERAQRRDHCMNTCRDRRTQCDAHCQIDYTHCTDTCHDNPSCSSGCSTDIDRCARDCKEDCSQTCDRE